MKNAITIAANNQELQRSVIQSVHGFEMEKPHVSEVNIETWNHSRRIFYPPLSSFSLTHSVFLPHVRSCSWRTPLTKEAETCLLHEWINVHTKDNQSFRCADSVLWKMPGRHLLSPSSTFFFLPLGLNWQSSSHWSTSINIKPQTPCTQFSPIWSSVTSVHVLKVHCKFVCVSRVQTQTADLSEMHQPQR